jgi:hypothetical protein
MPIEIVEVKIPTKWQDNGKAIAYALECEATEHAERLRWMQVQKWVDRSKDNIRPEDGTWCRTNGF